MFAPLFIPLDTKIHNRNKIEDESLLSMGMEKDILLNKVG